jgi:Fe-S-cluster-containing dehydrogenase component
MSESGTTGVAGTGVAGTGESRSGPTGLSRRRLLQCGLAAVPAAIGAQLLLGSSMPSGADAVSAAEPQPAADAYDPAAHDWAFVIDTTTCIGCGRCVEACKLENHVPEDGELNRTWVELHVVAEDGSVTIESPDGGRHGFPAEDASAPADASPVRDAYFVPRTCMQCENPPCTWVCPVSATYRSEDGVVLVDETRCIGCGYCLIACPYGARYMVPAGEVSPKGVAGVVDKCTFCYHRITRGKLPACAEVCPVSARIFGDLRDPASAVSVALTEKRVRVMKPALGTRPRVYYTGLEGEVE